MMSNLNKIFVSNPHIFFQFFPVNPAAELTAGAEEKTGGNYMPYQYDGKVWVPIRESGIWKLKSISEPIGQYREIPFPSKTSLDSFIATLEWVDWVIDTI